jgi:hypothetical protein
MPSYRFPNAHESYSSRKDDSLWEQYKHRHTIDAFLFFDEYVIKVLRKAGQTQLSSKFKWSINWT